MNETLENRETHETQDRPEPLRVGFARGVAPSKWANRWRAAHPDLPLELVPLLPSGSLPREEAAVDVLIDRTSPDERPAGTEGTAEAPATRHAVRLYTESVALVVPADHELAERPSVDVEELALVTLLAHPDHSARWPAAEPWADPSYAPRHSAGALDLVSTGLGAILLPLPLARHLGNKREHAVLPVVGDIAGSTVWASWDVARDDADVQAFIGVLRGRTARSSRPATGGGGAADGADDAASGARRTRSTEETSGTSGTDPAPRQRSSARQAQQAQQPRAAKKTLKPNSRGAQLAAAREKAERRKAEKRKQKRRKR